MCALGLCTTTYGASSGTYSVSGTEKFEAEWEYTNTYYMGVHEVAKMVFGFDMYAVDEDYVWTKGYECNSIACLYQEGNGTWIQGTERVKNVYSKNEKAHKTSRVIYGIWLEATYGKTLTHTTASSWIK